MGDDDGIVMEVVMFEEDVGIFFVNVDGIFDGVKIIIMGGEFGIYVMNGVFVVVVKG